MPIHERLRSIVTITVPVIALLVVLVFIISPNTVDNLAKEDSWVENLSAAALFVAALSMVVIGARKFRSKSTLLMLVSILTGVTFFVIGMEEISWGQRVLEIETNEFFLEHNVQNEMNLHNLNTHASEVLYYTGAFFLLVLIPFFRKQAKKLLAWVKLDKLEPLLPSAWLVIPFSIIVGFVKTNTYDVTVFSVAPIIIVPLLLLAVLFNSKNKPSYLTIAATLVALLTVLLSAVLFSFYDYDANGIRNWFATEWKELFIAIGLAVYAVDLYLKKPSASS